MSVATNLLYQFQGTQSMAHYDNMQVHMDGKGRSPLSFFERPWSRYVNMGLFSDLYFYSHVVFILIENLLSHLFHEPLKLSLLLLFPLTINFSSLLSFSSFIVLTQDVSKNGHIRKGCRVRWRAGIATAITRGRVRVPHRTREGKDKGHTVRI